MRVFYVNAMPQKKDQLNTCLSMRVNMMTMSSFFVPRSPLNHLNNKWRPIEFLALGYQQKNQLQPRDLFVNRPLELGINYENCNRPIRRFLHPNLLTLFCAATKHQRATRFTTVKGFLVSLSQENDPVLFY